MKLIFDKKIQTMNLAQKDWVSRLDSDTNAVILDVRTRQECSQGIIENAIMMDIFQQNEFISQLHALDISKSYYVYCKAGGRSEQACFIMNQLGFESAYNLMGGIMQWQGDIVLPKY